MKSIVFNLIGISVLMLFIQCSGSKKVAYELQKEAPFQILKAEYRDWIGGVEGVRGSLIEIVINNQETAIDTLYFRGHRIVPKVKQISKTDLQISGSILNKSKPILILHENPTEEYGNVAPDGNASFPFALIKKEMVLSYKHNNKIQYLKIELQKKETQFFE